MAMENSVVFTEEEQGRILFHLGYSQVQISSFLAFGVLALSENEFISVSALQHVPQSRAMIVRDLLMKCEAIEAKIFEASDYLIADKLEQLSLREDPTGLLEQEHTRWAKRLADALGVTVNPYSERFSGGKPSMNFRVRAPHA